MNIVFRWMSHWTKYTMNINLIEIPWSQLPFTCTCPPSPFMSFHISGLRLSGVLFLPANFSKLPLNCKMDKTVKKEALPTKCKSWSWVWAIAVTHQPPTFYLYREIYSRKCVLCRLNGDNLPTLFAIANCNFCYGKCMTHNSWVGTFCHEKPYASMSICILHIDNYSV